MQRFQRFFAIITLGLIMAGCSDSDTDQANAVVTGEARTIAHAMGETSIPAKPQRIVALSVEATETLLALGITPVGAVRSETADPANSWFAHIRDQMADVTVVGEEKQVNLEVVASLQPDLIIGLKTRQEQIYPQLSAIAPTVFANEFFGKLRENLLLFSDAVNRRIEGEALVAGLDEEISELSGRLSEQGLLEQEVAVIRFQVTGARYYYNDSFAAGLIKDLGFARPELHDTLGFAEPITMERIPEADADIQFYFTFAATDPTKGAENASSWLSHSMWQQLRASQSGRVYEVDNDIWNKSYGILSGRKVLDDIEAILLGARES